MSGHRAPGQQGVLEAREDDRAEISRARENSSRPALFWCNGQPGRMACYRAHAVHDGPPPTQTIPAKADEAGSSRQPPSAGRCTERSASYKPERPPLNGRLRQCCQSSPWTTTQEQDGNEDTQDDQDDHGVRQDPQEDAEDRAQQVAGCRHDGDTRERARVVVLLQLAGQSRSPVAVPGRLEMLGVGALVVIWSTWYPMSRADRTWPLSMSAITCDNLACLYAVPELA
jgi:hypothetical protein